MKKSWQENWIKELDERVPALNADVINAPIVMQNQAVTPEKKKAKGQNTIKVRLENALCALSARIRAKKRFVMRLTATMAALLLLFVTSSVAIPGLIPNEMGAFALEINPRAVFAVNSKGVVTSVVAGNADADVILASDKRKNAMKGKSVAQAMTIFVDYAAQLGFLDMETGDAVRVSMCMNDGDETQIRNSLVDYFCEKGVYVAVIAEEVSVQTFCDRMGDMSSDTLQELVKALDKSPALYLEQEVKGKTLAQVQAMYQEAVKPEKVKTSVESLLTGALQFIEEREKSLQEIAELNEMIKKDEDNPKLIWKDYWSVKKTKDPKDFTLRFRLLMQAMEILVKEHEVKYNVTIDSEMEFKALQWTGSSDFLSDLAQLLADFSMEVFNGSTEFLTEALSFIGVDVDLMTICETPEDTQEYLEKSKSLHEMRYRSLRMEYLYTYGSDREQITADAYEAYLQSIYQEYGSLDNYWQAKSA